MPINHNGESGSNPEKTDIIFFQPACREGFWLVSNALLELASYISQRGFNVKLVHLGMDKDYEGVILKSLKKYSPRYVCICLRWHINSYLALEIARITKDYNPGIATFFGGHTASCFSEEIVSNFPYVDVVVSGDGELPLLNILKGKEKLNCTYREGSKVIKQPISYVQDEASLEGMHLANLSDILESDRILGICKGKDYEPFENLAYIWVGKGCSNNCFYCGARRDSQRQFFARCHIVFRSISDVMKDIEEYCQLGFGSIAFDFDPYMDDRGYYFSLFGEIRKKFGLTLNCVFSSWNRPNKALMEELSRTFKMAIVNISPETFDESLKKRLSESGLLRPHHSNEEVFRIAKEIDDYDNLFLEINLVAGLPLEEKTTFARDISFSRKLIEECPNSFYKGSGKYVPIIYRPLHIEPGTFMDPETKSLAERSGLGMTHKGFLDFYNASKEGMYKGNFDLGFRKENNCGFSQEEIQSRVNIFRCSIGSLWRRVGYKRAD